VKFPAGRSRRRVAFDLPQAARREIKEELRQRFGARGSTSMMDILMLALAFGLFALAIGYTYACERL
jgi:hypothetical protein